MNAVVRLERSGFNEDGLREYTFTTTSKLDLSKDKSYVIDLKEKKPKRSLAQNDMYWGILSKICMKQDGNLKDLQELHCQMLKMSGAAYVIITVEDKDIEKIKKDFDIRAMTILSKQVVNHRLYDLVQIFKGSSKFDTAEMSQLIDTALDYAAKIGIETDYGRDLLAR